MKCPVPECHVIGRFDYVKKHIKNTVIWSKNHDGEQAQEFEYKRAKKDQKIHTKFWQKNGFSFTNQTGSNL